MEGLGPFLVFIAIMFVNVYTSNKRKKQKGQAKIPSEIAINTEVKTKQVPPNTKKHLDYMMAKPKDIKDKSDNEPIIFTSVEEPKAEKINIFNVQDKKQIVEDESLYKKDIDNQDVIEQTEIKTAKQNSPVHIDIEKENIMKAVMYAQVLERPKSLDYLKRFGIYRQTHKD